MAFFSAMFGAGSGMLGGALSAIGTIVTAIGQANAAEAQARIAEMNAEIQRRNAALAAEHGREQAMFQDRRNKALAAKQAAEMSASGVKLGSPSFLRARESLAKVAGEEVFSIVRAADRRAWSYNASAAVYEAQASAYREAADNYIMSGFIGAATSLVGSARPYYGPSIGLQPRTWRAPTYT